MLEIWQRAVIFFSRCYKRKAAYMQLNASFGSISLHMLQCLINEVIHYYFQARYILKFCFHNLVIAFSRLHEFKNVFCKTDFVTIIFAMLIRQFRVVVCIFIWKNFQLVLSSHTIKYSLATMLQLCLNLMLKCLNLLLSGTLIEFEF